jgi:hypothetical protein
VEMWPLQGKFRGSRLLAGKMRSLFSVLQNLKNKKSFVTCVHMWPKSCSQAAAAAQAHTERVTLNTPPALVVFRTDSQPTSFEISRLLAQVFLCNFCGCRSRGLLAAGGKAVLAEGAMGRRRWMRAVGNWKAFLKTLQYCCVVS